MPEATSPVRVIPPLSQGDDQPRLDQATVGDEQRLAALGILITTDCHSSAWRRPKAATHLSVLINCW
jgi:hypothetical protein